MSHRLRGATLAAAGAAALAAACAPAPPPADIVLLGGRIVTLDDDRPEARALAARAGRIVALGDERDVRPLIGEATRVIELDGRLAVPGLIESHGHFTGIGHARRTLDLTTARSWEEICRRVAEAATRAAPGQWIVGWGWHQEKWDSPPQPAVEGYPTHAGITRAAPDNPVLLKHAAGSHAGIANAAALRAAGIDRDTPDPPGGHILRLADGEPSGVLRETAYALALAALDRAESARSPREIAADARREIELADAECLSKGITTFQDAGSDIATVELLRGMAEAGEIGVRLWVMVREPSAALAPRLADLRVVGAADDHFTLLAIKAAIDGALGSHGAWLLEPYADLPGSTGYNTTPLDELQRLAELAAGHDMQFCVHAIGDRGNRETLDLYERVLAAHPGSRDRRWRIEHAQHLHPDDIPRFAALGVVASIQGVHCTSDGPWVPQRLGQERAARGAYAWRSLLDAGVVLANGTDAPVEDVDPIANFYSSVTRRMGDGTAFHPEQRMTRLEALRSYTLDAAYAAFEETLKGSLAPGKLADVTVLSQDILEVPEERIRDTRVVYTIVGGEVRYARGEDRAGGPGR